VTDAADGGIADRGGGRGSYRVIEINAGQILQRAHSSTVHLIRCPLARARASGGNRRKKNKATAKQSPRAQALSTKSPPPKERLRVSNWIMQRPYNYAVKKTVELRFLTVFQHVVDPTRIRAIADKNSAACPFDFRPTAAN
jgi:hypothetical protein